MSPPPGHRQSLTFVGEDDRTEVGSWRPCGQAPGRLKGLSTVALI